MHEWVNALSWKVLLHPVPSRLKYPCTRNILVCLAVQGSAAGLPYIHVVTLDVPCFRYSNCLVEKIAPPCALETESFMQPDGSSCIAAQRSAAGLSLTLTHSLRPLP